MDGGGTLLSRLLLVLVRQVDKQVDHVVELVQVAKTVLIDGDFFEDEVLRPTNHVLDLAAIMPASDSPELGQRNAVLCIQVWRVEQGILEGGEESEVQVMLIPFFQPRREIRGVKPLSINQSHIHSLIKELLQIMSVPLCDLV